MRKIDFGYYCPLSLSSIRDQHSTNIETKITIFGICVFVTFWDIHQTWKNIIIFSKKTTFIEI